MTHDGTSGPVTRKERRAAYGKTQKKKLRPFTPSDYVRKDWTPEEAIESLEVRARGYNGLLREILCTAAAMLRDAASEDLLRENGS